MTAEPRVEVRFRGKVPAASEAFDQAREVGELLLARFHLKRCRVVVNANRRRVLSWRLARKPAELSVHWSLLPFPREVVDVMEGVPGVWPRLRSNLPTAAPPAVVQPLGAVHDLASHLAAQRLYVPTAPEVTITWGQWPRTPPHRSLRLGSCEGSLVRIHPVLDHVQVPDWLVGFIVFHELLHTVHLPEDRGGRRVLHTQAFRRAEAHHPDFGRAKQWEKDHITRLLARVRAEVRGQRVSRRSRRSRNGR